MSRPRRSFKDSVRARSPQGPLLDRYLPALARYGIGDLNKMGSGQGGTPHEKLLGCARRPPALRAGSA